MTIDATGPGLRSSSGLDRPRMAVEDLVAMLRDIFRKLRCSPATADLLARNCAAAERDGIHGHGIFRLPHYAADLALDGWVDGWASPTVEQAGPAMLRVDAANGYAVPALAAAAERSIEQARAHGVAVIAIRNSHHLGALSLDVEPLAQRGLIVLSTVNSMRAVVPPGGRHAVFGTNPIAFAAPRLGQPPLVIDMATSAMAHGDVQIAARDGRPLPEHAGVDRDGRATNDAAAVLDGGALLPFGGHKGAALCLMVEILCAGLVDASFSAEMDLRRHPGAVTPRTGQSLILIDPDRGRSGPRAFADRIEDLFSLLAASGQERLPGERRLRHRAAAETDGLSLSPASAAILADFSSRPALAARQSARR